MAAAIALWTIVQRRGSFHGRNLIATDFTDLGEASLLYLWEQNKDLSEES
jgi:hypothetical protein